MKNFWLFPRFCSLYYFHFFLHSFEIINKTHVLGIFYLMKNNMEHLRKRSKVTQLKVFVFSDDNLSIFVVYNNIIYVCIKITFNFTFQHTIVLVSVHSSSMVLQLINNNYYFISERFPCGLGLWCFCSISVIRLFRLSIKTKLIN